MILAILTLITSLVISGVAGYFSIVGLAAIFAATFWPVIIMGTVLEIGKIVSVAWLHRYWKTAPKILKSYLIAAVAVLMIITSMGIFGFLSKGHLEQGLPAQDIVVKSERIDQQIENTNNKIERFKSEMAQLDSAIDVYFKNDKATAGLEARKKQEKERNEIEKNINDSYAELDSLQTQKSDLKSQNILVEAKLGPILYVAQLFGWHDMGTAVSIVIFMIMFAFDPIALSLLVAAQFSFMNRPKKVIVNSVQPTPSPVISPITEEPPANTTIEKTPEYPLPEITPEIEEEIIETLESDPLLAEEIKNILEAEENEKKKHGTVYVDRGWVDGTFGSGTNKK